MAAHRYWRIFITECHDGSLAGFDELDLRESISGPRLSVTGACTATASTTDPAGYAASGVLDELTYSNSSHPTRAWFSLGSGQGNNSWVALDFGSGFAYEMRYLGIKNVSSGEATNNSPKNGFLQWSDDGSTWTSAFPFSNHPNTLGGYSFYIDLSTVVAVGAHADFAVTAPVASGYATMLTGVSIGVDIYRVGRGRISGTVKIDNTPTDTPVRRRVLLLREPDYVVVADTWSNKTTGAYAFEWIDEKAKYMVLAVDYTHSYRGVLADNVTPELMT